MKKIRNFIKTKKILSLVILVVILGIGYFIYGKTFPIATVTSYVYDNVKKGSIVSTITGTGQISAENQLDVKSKVSGDIVYLNTQDNGKEIKKGTLIAQVDTRDAEISLKNAKIAYAKLLSLDTPTTLQSYEDSFNVVTSTFLDFPNIINGINDILYSRNGYIRSENIRNVSQKAIDYQTKAGISFDRANTIYTNLLTSYQDLSRTSSTSTLQSFVTNTYFLTKDISEVLKNVKNTIDYVRQQKNDGTGSTESTNISSWSNTINLDLSNLLSAQTNLRTSSQAIIQNNLNIDSQKLDLQQKEWAYEDYFIRAPFDAILARLSIKSTDSISSGTVIGTLVSLQKISTITLNEVDIGKVHIGQKTKMTFDAVDGLTIDGTVTTVDLVGTVTQGVVNYNVTIALDTTDNRIKSGMSVTANIITDTKKDILIVPNSAIKTQGRFNYVELPSKQSNIPLIQKKVELGITNDLVTEIISGLNEGDKIITRTITATKTNTTVAPSLFGNGTRIGKNTSSATRTNNAFPKD